MSGFFLTPDDASAVSRKAQGREPAPNGLYADGDFEPAALAVTGSEQDVFALFCVERFLSLRARFDEFNACIADLIEKHADNPDYVERCRRVAPGHSAVVDTEVRNVLDEWSPAPHETERSH